MDKEVFDLSTDYVISSFGQVTATSLSSLLSGSIRHDRITRFLNAAEFTSAHLWKLDEFVAFLKENSFEYTESVLACRMSQLEAAVLKALQEEGDEADWK